MPIYGNDCEPGKWRTETVSLIFRGRWIGIESGSDLSPSHGRCDVRKCDITDEYLGYLS